jgi:N-hydroxyarylamine O-acetyltransferase
MDIDVARYLGRIGFAGEVRQDVATLEALQRTHMTAVPFENLHVFHRRGVQTGVDWSVPKILDGRGGWCFELNGAFAALLESLGFMVTKLSAAVMLGGDPPAGFDHLTLRVDLDEPYLVDVGFGDSFIRPLRLDREGEQDGGTMPFRLRSYGTGIVLESYATGEWSPEYRFDQVPRELQDFDARSEHLQTAPGLGWTLAPFATRLLGEGPDRVWLLHDRLKFRRNGKITTSPVAAEEWPQALSTWFDMVP